MGLNVGNLHVTLQLDSGDFESSIRQARTSLEDVARAAENVDKKKIKPGIDTAQVDKAKSSTEQLDSELGKVDKKKVRPDVDKQPIEDAKKSTDGLIDSLGSLASKGVKWSASAAAMAGIGTIGASIAKGFGRLDSIDQATAKLEALGNSGASVENIMDNALTSVKGTAFGIGEAAGTAATMVASGIKPGQELESVLKGVADSAAIGGASMEEMGLIWGKAAAKGKIDGEIVNQILERQIPIYEILSQKTGEATEDIAKMVSDGKIDFQTFSEAMNDYVGGGAVRMGDTISGAMDNVGAALGRAGASFLEGGMSEAPGLLSKLTEQIDLAGDAVGPLGTSISSKLAPALSSVVDNLAPTVVGGMSALNSTMEAGAPLASGLGSALEAIPLPVMAGGVAALVAQHKGWNTQLGDGVGKVRDFASNTGRSLASAVRSFDSAYDRGSANMRGIAFSLETASRAAKQNSLATKDAFTSIDYMGQSAAKSFAASATHMGASAKGLSSGGLAVLKQGAEGTKNAVGGLFTALGGWPTLAIAGATTAVGFLMDQHRKAAEAELEHKAAQKELRDTLDQTTGAITEQTNELQRNRAEENGWIEAGTSISLTASTITDAMNGSEDAIRKVDTAVKNSTGKVVEASQFWGDWGGEFQQFGVDAGDVAGYLNDSAESTDKFNDALREVREVYGAGSAEDMALTKAISGLRKEFKDTGDEAWNLRDGVVGASDEINELQVEDAKERLNELRESAEQTKDVLEVLGDTAFQIEGKKELSIEATPDTLGLMDDLNEIEGITAQALNGRIHMEFSDGVDIIQMLDTIGIKLEKTPDGHLRVNADDLDAASAYLDEIGLKTQNIDGIGLVIDMNDAEVMARLEELEFAVKDPVTGEIDINWDSILESEERMEQFAAVVNEGADGEARLTDNADEVEGNVQKAWGVVEKGAKGTARMSDNSVDVSQNIDRNLKNKTTNGYHKIWEQYYSSGRATSTGGTSVGQHYGYNGGIMNFADGAVTAFSNSKENHIAQIAKAGAWRVWAEDETGGEAYIPLAKSKRERSETILSEVAKRFGKTIIDQDAIAFADGGISEKVKGDLAHANGTPYVFGGWGPGGTDCSGAVAMGVNSALGLDPYDSRMATFNEGEWLENKGFIRGKGGEGSIRVAYLNGGPGGGHTAMQLPDGTFVESGGNTGGGLTIGGPAGPLEGRGFTDWYYLPMEEGDMPEFATGMGESFDTATGGAGGGRRPASSYGTSGGGGGGVSTTISGGAGPLVQDGSVLELAAAMYAHKTGQPMPDDVVSWGNVMGYGTHYETDDAERELRHNERELRALKRDREGTERDIEQAKADLKKMLDELDAGGKETGSGKNKKFEAYTPEEVAERKRKALDQRDKILDLEDSLEDYGDKHAELIASQEKLRVAVERAADGPTSFGETLRVTAMATGGILGGARNAQIRDSSAVLWAEAGPEAYIPLSKKRDPNALATWTETGKRLGVDAVSAFNMMASGLPGLAEGRLDFNTGASASAEAMGVNMDAARYRTRSASHQQSQAVGAVFNGPVQVNDPQRFIQQQLNSSGNQLNIAMKGLMIK